jgi:NADH-quinone oxidoreductase subunit M
MSCLLLTLLLLPLVGSGLVFAWKSNSSKYLALGIALVQMLLTFYVLSDFDFTPTVDSVLQHEINYPWSQFMKSSLHFGIDGMSMLLLLLTNILAPIIILSSFNENVNYRNTFYGLILLMQFGLVGVFTSLDGLLFYIFWEVTLIPIWFIAGLWGQENKRFEFTTKFFVYTFVGSLFMLAGLIYVYNHSASFALTDLYNAQLNETQQTVVFWFIFFAFAVKLPVFPFHTWQPDTYTYSPTQGSMLLSGIMLKMAVYGVMRYLLPITPLPIAGISGQIVIILAIVGIVHGALIAIIQTDMKRIIAYSSFSHVGLMVAGIFASAVVTLRGTFNVEGAEGALVQTLLTVSTW